MGISYLKLSSRWMMQCHAGRASET